MFGLSSDDSIVTRRQDPGDAVSPWLGEADSDLGWGYSEVASVVDDPDAFGGVHEAWPDAPIAAPYTRQPGSAAPPDRSGPESRGDSSAARQRGREPAFANGVSEDILGLTTEETQALGGFETPPFSFEPSPQASSYTPAPQPDPTDDGPVGDEDEDDGPGGYTSGAEPDCEQVEQEYEAAGVNVACWPKADGTCECVEEIEVTAPPPPPPEDPPFPPGGLPPDFIPIPECFVWEYTCSCLEPFSSMWYAMGCGESDQEECGQICYSMDNECPVCGGYAKGKNRDEACRKARDKCEREFRSKKCELDYCEDAA